MPVRPRFTWEQTKEEVFIHVVIKGYKKEAVDVLISELFVKVNAPPRYLLSLDLLHPVDVESSRYYFDQQPLPEADGAEAPALVLHLQLKKQPIIEEKEEERKEGEEASLWAALTVESLPKSQLLERRTRSMQKAEERYNRKLQERKAQREGEKRRLTEAQWEVERGQRHKIEERMAEEKRAAEEDLYAWEKEGEVQKNREKDTKEEAAKQLTGVRATPADLLRAYTPAVAGPSPEKKDSTPQVRGSETINVTVHFTPKYLSLPSRSRGDEDYYRRSRYKPVSVGDSPLFWKEKGDTFYRKAMEHHHRRDTPAQESAALLEHYREAIRCYSESIKRDGVFLSCILNRAACYLQLLQCDKCVEDCTLGLTMVSNTPASEMTQDRYRAVLTKLYSRRAAAYCWSGRLPLALSDLKMAAAYNIFDHREEEGEEASEKKKYHSTIQKDIEVVETLMKEKGIPLEGEEGAGAAYASRMQEAARHYYQHDYAAAVKGYSDIVDEEPRHPQARSNRSAALLMLQQFKPALEDCVYLIDLCREVTSALQDTQRDGGIREAFNSDDSDAEEEEDDDNDEEEEEEEEIIKESTSTEAHKTKPLTRKQKKEASRLLGERTSQVYLLLKAYVRASAALCALKDYPQALAFLEQAVRISPYDNDLHDDYGRLVEKVRMDTLISASSGSAKNEKKK